MADRALYARRGLGSWTRFRVALQVYFITATPVIVLAGVVGREVAPRRERHRRPRSTPVASLVFSPVLLFMLNRQSPISSRILPPRIFHTGTRTFKLAVLREFDPKPKNPPIWLLGFENLNENGMKEKAPLAAGPLRINQCGFSPQQISHGLCFVLFSCFILTTRRHCFSPGTSGLVLLWAL